MERGGEVGLRGWWCRVWELWEMVRAAKVAAWERIWRRGRRSEWRMLRWRRKVCWLDWLRERWDAQNLGGWLVLVYGDEVLFKLYVLFSWFARYALTILKPSFCSNALRSSCDIENGDLVSIAVNLWIFGRSLAAESLLQLTLSQARAKGRLVFQDRGIEDMTSSEELEPRTKDRDCDRVHVAIKVVL
jgi:hypothetical protein